MDPEIVLAELPHHLTAHTAGREKALDDTVLAAADSDGGKLPLAVGDGLEEGGALSADRGGIGGVFDVAAGVDGAVGAKDVPRVESSTPRSSATVAATSAKVFLVPRSQGFTFLPSTRMGTYSRVWSVVAA